MIWTRGWLKKKRVAAAAVVADSLSEDCDGEDDHGIRDDKKTSTRTEAFRVIRKVSSKVIVKVSHVNNVIVKVKLDLGFCPPLLKRTTGRSDSRWRRRRRTRRTRDDVSGSDLGRAGDGGDEAGWEGSTRTGTSLELYGSVRGELGHGPNLGMDSFRSGLDRGEVDDSGGADRGWHGLSLGEEDGEGVDDWWMTGGVWKDKFEEVRMGIRKAFFPQGHHCHLQQQQQQLQRQRQVTTTRYQIARLLPPQASSTSSTSSICTTFTMPFLVKFKAIFGKKKVVEEVCFFFRVCLSSAEYHT